MNVRHGLVLLLVFASARPASALGFQLLPAGSVNIQVGAYDVKAADLDGDGRPEAVAGVADQKKIAVVQNDGLGHLTTVTNYAAGTVQAVALQDFDGDGKIDVATADWTENRMTLRLNQGGGVLGPAIFVPMGTSPRDLVGADLDGDGFLDAAVATGTGQLAIRRGLGAGAFGAVTIVNEPGAQFKAIAAGDLDHDGRIDLALIDYARHLLATYLNQGNFVFTAGPGMVMPTGASDLKLADLDGDGWLDVAVANENGTATVTRNLHGGLFDTPNSFNVGHLSQSIDVADFDGDTIPDLVVSNYNESTVSLLLGSGGMQFTSGGTAPTGASPRAASVGDFDGDGRIDVVSGDFAGGTVRLLRNAPAIPQVDLLTNSLEYGTRFTGLTQTLDVQVRNKGAATLVLTPGSTGNAEFTVVSPAGSMTVAPAAIGLVTVRYERTAEGEASGTLHVATNDGVVPEITVPLHGTSAPPPIALTSAPPPMTLAAGNQATGSLRIRNLGGSPMQVTVTTDLIDLAETSALDLGPTSEAFLRADASQALWDVGFDGSIGSGTENSYANGMDLVSFAAEPGGVLGLGGRELRLGPQGIEGLSVTRKIYVSPDLGFARYVDVVENPGTTAATWNYSLIDNLSFAQALPIQTSSGDATFTPEDSWVVIPSDGVAGHRAIGRVVTTANGLGGPTFQFYGQNTTHSFTRSAFSGPIAPHRRFAFVQWAIQGVDAADAVAKAQALAQSPAWAYEHMDAIDRSTAFNVDQVLPVFQATPGTFTLASSDSADIDVVFNGALSSHASQITGSLRILTDDPQHAEILVPVSLTITGGAVVAVDPGTAPAGARLALAGFRPNPFRGVDGARIAYSLASNAPASITLYDVRGRVVARRVIESPAPGSGSIALGARLAPGVVWMRIEQEGRTATARGVVLP